VAGSGLVVVLMHKIRLFTHLERTVARGEECQAALYRQARVMQSVAQARLSRHRKTGQHRIFLSKGRIDHFVNLAGPAAMAIEEGHHAPDGTFVRGLRILRGML
jgi:hypothetical protein